MLKKIVAVCLLVGMMTAVMVQAMEKEDSQRNISVGLDVGLKAPNFELENLHGEKVQLSDFKGKKVMINFWATWCPPCKAEMPDMQKFYEQYGDQVTILAINIDPEYDVKGFVQQMNISFPILLDDQDKVSSAYKILTIPTTFIIDEKGIIQYKQLSAMSFDMMKKITAVE